MNFLKGRLIGPDQTFTVLSHLQYFLGFPKDLVLNFYELTNLGKETKKCPGQKSVPITTHCVEVRNLKEESPEPSQC